MKPVEITCRSAACTVWRNGPALTAAGPTAAIGRIACADPAVGRDLIRKVEMHLRREGVRQVVAPMDGDTWHSYRCPVDGDGSPPFLLEPQGPDCLPQTLAAAGFRVIGRYVSDRIDDLDRIDNRPDENWLAGSGLGVRRFSPEAVESELTRIHRLSLTAFADNFLYQPISRADFLALYRPLMAQVDSRWVLMAENAAGDLAGFLFALPDWLQGDRPRQLIVKTYASRVPGLGRYLLAAVHRDAAEAGFRSVVHALMHVDNVSRRHSGKYAATFRRYALYGKVLAPAGPGRGA
jgi:hypothetical protein